jgi:antitoxin MazE
MKARIVRIGNSQGIRIPKPFLEQSGLEGEVELELHPDGIVIKPSSPPRAGWDEAFASMAAAGDEALLDADILGDELDEGEWTW